jgi:hypothetical protein
MSNTWSLSLVFPDHKCRKRVLRVNYITRLPAINQRNVFPWDAACEMNSHWRKHSISPNRRCNTRPIWTVKILMQNFRVYPPDNTESKPSLPKLYPLRNWVHINNPKFVTHWNRTHAIQIRGSYTADGTVSAVNNAFHIKCFNCTVN